jgi:hypothetical protein
MTVAVQVDSFWIRWRGVVIAALLLVALSFAAFVGGLTGVGVPVWAGAFLFLGGVAAVLLVVVGMMAEAWAGGGRHRLIVRVLAGVAIAVVVGPVAVYWMVFGTVPPTPLNVLGWVAPSGEMCETHGRDAERVPLLGTDITLNDMCLDL